MKFTKRLWMGLLGTLVMAGFIGCAGGSASSTQSASSGQVRLNWLTSYSKALAQAKQEHKQVFMEFEGSDWCPHCRALRTEVLETPTFSDYAKKNLVLLKVDFPEHTPISAAQAQANEALSNKYGVHSFPTVVILNGEGRDLARFKGEQDSAESFVQQLQSLKN